MSKLAISALATTILVACASVKMAEEIVLPNGKKGMTIDCTMQGWPACFKSAGELCKQGYNIYERTLDKEVRSEIPISELEDEESFSKAEPAPAPNPDMIQHREKYMVIACK